MDLLRGEFGLLFSPKQMGIKLGKITFPDPINSCLDFSSSDSFSIEFWLKTRNLDFSVINKIDDGVGYTITVTDLGTLSFIIGDGKNWVEKEGDFIVNDNKWHHVICTRNAGKGVSIYVDGEIDGLSASGDVSSLATSKELIVGGHKENYFDLALLRFFGAYINKQQAKILKTMQVPEELELVLRTEWNFEDSTKTTVHDKGKNGCCGYVETGTKLYNLAEVTKKEKVGIGNGKETGFNLEGSNIDGLIVFLDNERIGKGNFFFTPEGRFRLLEAPRPEVIITATYGSFPILYEIGGFDEWKMDYNTNPVACGSRDKFRNYVSSKISWELQAKSFWVTSREKRFPSGKFMVQAIDGNKYLSSWMKSPDTIGPANPRNTIIDKKLIFTGEGLIGTEIRRQK